MPWAQGWLLWANRQQWDQFHHNTFKRIVSWQVIRICKKFCIQHIHTWWQSNIAHITFTFCICQIKKKKSASFPETKNISQCMLNFCQLLLHNLHVSCEPTKSYLEPILNFDLISVKCQRICDLSVCNVLSSPPIFEGYHLSVCLFLMFYPHHQKRVASVCL